MKLSPKQKEVIMDVINGATICTDASFCGAIISFPPILGGKQYHINNRVFWNLVDKGLFVQGNARDNFNYKLTNLALELFSTNL